MKPLKIVIATVIFVTITGCNSTTNISNVEISKSELNSTNNVLENSNTYATYNTNKRISNKVSNLSSKKTLAPFKQAKKICENDQNNDILESIKSILVHDLNVNYTEIDTLEIHRSLYEVYLGNTSKGMIKQLVAITTSNIFLFETNYDYSDIKFLDKVDNAIINLSKSQIHVKNNTLEILSEDSFSAAISSYLFEWNGIKFKMMEENTKDNTKEFFSTKKELLDNKDIDGLMNLSAKEDKLLNPTAYDEFYTLPKNILILAHNISLSEFNNGNIEKAYPILEYGIEQYSKVWFQGDLTNITSEKIKEKNKTCNPDNLISIDKFIPIYNNYAFFLSEVGKYEQAEIFLNQIIEIDSKRTPSYINLADIEWKLDKHDLAKKHYKIYLKLLKNNTKDVPKRVFERINSKQ